MSGLIEFGEIPPIEYLYECFWYSPEGRLYWRARPKEHFKSNVGYVNFNNQFRGRPAGWAKTIDGRKEIKWDGKTYKAARLIWAFFYRQTLFGCIDHIDGDPSNDRIDNLREVTSAQNARNRSATSNNSSGVTGVTWHSQSGKWWARVTLDGKTHSLGLHENIQAAAAQVAKVKKRLYGEYARHAQTA